MTDHTPDTAPRVAAGTLFVKDDRVLLVHRTIYENGWDIPGALVGAGESPAGACRRELREDLQLDRTPQRLLIVDWVPGDGDEFLYIFDCGAVHDSEVRLALGRNGLDRWEWVPVDQLAGYVPAELARRFALAHQVSTGAGWHYLERGEPAIGQPEPPAALSA